MTIFTPPQFMEQGSQGPAVDSVLQFLHDWACKGTNPNTGIIIDGDYGTTGILWMKEYQKAHGIDIDGGCGPQTRSAMLRDGFDFYEEAKKTTGVTDFAQPDGSVLYWAPGLEINQQRQFVQDYVDLHFHNS